MSQALGRLTAALSDRYRLERELGQGGMATVYLAQDLRHDRRVALKVLKPELAAVIGAERFLQEIKTTANLQHPHILALFDSGQVATTDPASGDTTRTVFYVMPFVEGESLRDRLNREKQLPVGDALRIAGEVASALDYAHRRGVIHRDIKPENILLHDAQALVADFGIALAASRSEGGSRMTETGMSLGTPHYMSPEQAMGERNLDARTDVYALGCVLYEMLTGEPPFTGPTAQAIVARVMTEVPRSVTLQRKAVPPHVEAAVLTALEKLPADRFATAAEFLTALGDTARRPTGGSAMTAAPSRLRRAIPWVLAAFGLALGAVSIWRIRQAPAPRAIRFSITPPAGVEIVSGGGLSLTADGRTLVFVSSRNGVTSLVRRNLDDPVFHRLEGTEGAQEPALSPDGRWVAFAASDGRIKKVALEGGRPIALITTGVPAGMQWSGRYGLVLGMPVFSPTIHGLSLLAPEGEPVLRPITDPGRGMHHAPALLADEETALFQDIGFGRRGGLGVVSLKTGDTSRVDLQLGQAIGVAAGTLLYLGTDKQLLAVPFDAKRNRITGTPIRLTEAGIQVERATLARDGTLAMAVAPQVLDVVLVDEQGRAEPISSEPTTRLIPRFSPDGRRIAMSADFRGTPSAWVLNLADRALLKLAFPQMPPSLNWTADGGRVIATSLTSRVYWQSADAGDTVSVLLRVADRQVIAASLAPDQRTLALATGQELSRFDIVSRSVQGDTAVSSLAASAANETSPRFSPDGKWLAYASDESGRYEVFARPFPGPGSRVQLSDAGGTEPVWSRDGRRLFYRVGRSMMAVDLTPGTVLTVAGRQRLFEGDFQSSDDFGFPVQTYDVSPDGRHFVMGRASGGARAEIVIWTNWLRELKTRWPMSTERLAAALADRYRIERELGQGGMATVYLAQDLRHDRQVALKVLKPELAAVIGAERFLQEIRTTANLQHPHILPLHDSGQVDGTVFYVMPFVQGESLRDRLTRDKQLPIDEAMRVAREVADALGYAHERGIIHRDIKPENILLQRGHALVADFGIALAASKTGGSRMTETGMSLGTPHYMSPEQAMGDRDLGPRSDVYALGCVCYEMLCGEPPFSGPTPQAIVARVMTEAPRSLRSQRQTVPENVEAAVLQALEKLPADRFGTAAEFAAALGQPSFTRATSSTSRAVGPMRRLPWKQVAIGLFGLVLVLGAGLLVALRRSADSDPLPRPVMRFEVVVPDSIPVEQIALTPDGTRLLLQATNRSYVYAFASMSWTPLPVPELKGFQSSSISPDSRWVAFIDDARNLKVVRLEGGAVRKLAETVRNVSWESDGFIYLVQRTDRRDRIARITPEGGALEELLVAPDSVQRLGLGRLLPGGKLIYTLRQNSQGERESKSFALDVASRKSSAVALAPGSWTFGYAPTGHLLVDGRDGVFAVGFDAKGLEVGGAPVPITHVLPLDVDFAAGTLVYSAATTVDPTLVDRNGRRRELPGIGAPVTWGFGARVSPSGHALAFWRYQGQADRWDVFTYRLPAGPLVRLTADSSGRNQAVSWTPDGQTVRFIGLVEGRHSALKTPWNGSGPVELLFKRPRDLNSMAWLPDGRVVIDEQGQGLLMVRPGGGDSAVALVPAAVEPRFPSLSPDGRWLAYSAVELGRREVFVRPLDGGSNRWQISRTGGNNPVWARSGRELFFYANDTVRVAAVAPGPGFEAGEPRTLFRWDYLPDYSGFDVLPGDSLFVLAASSQTEHERIFVVTNFLEELRALRAPPAGSRRP